jgi:hypothetical protein
LESETSSPPVQQAAAFDPRRRMRELLAIPDRDRTDAEWDELNELEIQTAPGNRVGNQPPSGYSGKPAFPAKNRSKGKGGHKPTGGRGPQQGKPAGGGQQHKSRQVQS